MGYYGSSFFSFYCLCVVVLRWRGCHMGLLVDGVVVGRCQGRDLRGGEYVL